MRVPRIPMTLQPSTAPSLGQPGAAETVGATGANDRVIVPLTIFWSDGQSHDVDVLHWRTGSATSPSFTLRVGLRDLDLAAGPPGRDDGTEDGNSGTHVNPTANTNYSTTLATPRTVAHGARLAWVFDFSAWASGSIRVPAGMTAQANQHGVYGTYYNGTTYALIAQALVPCLTVEAVEGASSVYGVAIPGLPQVTAAVATVSFNSSSSPDERSLAFELVQAAVRINFAWFLTTVAGGAFDIVLYNGTTVVGTFSVDDDTWSADAVGRWIEGAFAGSFAAGTYRLALKPTTATNVTCTELTLAAGHLEAIGGDAAGRAYALGHSTRTDAGSWSAPSDTTLPFPCFVDIEFDAASGGGGALLTHPGMSGGLNA